MLQTIKLQPYSPAFRQIKQVVPQLSQTELLELITYLAQQAQETAVSEPKPVYKWRDIAGAAPNLLEGQDAQTWVNQVRAEEWGRDVR